MRAFIFLFCSLSKPKTYLQCSLVENGYTLFLTTACLFFVFLLLFFSRNFRFLSYSYFENFINLYLKFRWFVSWTKFQYQPVRSRHKTSSCIRVARGHKQINRFNRTSWLKTFLWLLKRYLLQSWNIYEPYIILIDRDKALSRTRLGRASKETLRLIDLLINCETQFRDSMFQKFE